MKEEDFTRILELEEEYVQKICEDIIRFKPDIVFTEKGVSDLAQHYLVKVLAVLFSVELFIIFCFRRLASLRFAELGSRTTIALLVLAAPLLSTVLTKSERKTLAPRPACLKSRRLDSIAV